MSKTIVITGSSDGIGAAAARQLAAQGHRIVVVGRSPHKTRAVAAEVGGPHHLVDYTNLSQVRRLAEELLAAYPRIDVLANNAGGIFKRLTTQGGFEKTFQVNHLGGFLLTRLLMDRLIESNASIIQTSSIGAKLFGNIKLDDFTNGSTKWTMNRYGDSKLANILFTKELHHRYHAQGVSVAAFHPGNIYSNFAHDFGAIRLVYKLPLVKWALESNDDGGRRLAFLAEGTPGRDWQSGEYYEENKIAPPKKVNPQADDTALARELWDRSERLAGLTPGFEPRHQDEPMRNVPPSNDRAGPAVGV